MALYLVQHGRSLAKSQDAQQGLSAQGREETKRIAQVAAGYRVAVASIAHSGKKRALQTAEIMADCLNPPLGVTERQGLKPLDDVVPVAKTLRSADNVMLVGHLPFLERLVAHLITGAIKPIVFKFQNGGIVCLDTDQRDDDWSVRWALMPNIGDAQ